MTRKVTYAFLMQGLLWLFWWVGLTVSGDDVSKVFYDPIAYWVLGLIFPIGFGAWLCFVFPKGRPSDRYMATVFPGRSVIKWVWLPFVVELLVVWFWGQLQ